MAANAQDGKFTRVVAIAATATPIVAHSFCRRISVQENYTSAAGATTDTAMIAPIGGGEIIILKGVPVVFASTGPNGQYTPGQIVGSIRVLDVAGPINYQQVEDDMFV